MSNFDPENFEIKFQIADAATDLYMENDGEFLIREVANRVDIEPREVFNYFSDKESILLFYYASLIIRYEMMISEIDDFDSYTISEKLSNFAFTTFDMLSEKERFVEQTFGKLIVRNCGKTEFEKEIERLIKQFLEDDSRISISSTLVMNSYAYSFLRRQYLELVQFWLNDTSESHEISMELTDKLTGLLEEMLYNPVLDKGLDLIKFMNANRESFFQNLPIVKQFRSKFNIQ